MSTGLRIPIRAYLVALTFLAALPALGIIWHSGGHQLEMATLSALDQSRMLVAGAVAIQEHLTDSSIAMLKTLAALPEVKKRDAQALAALFATLLDRNPDLADIAALAPDGGVIASGRPHPAVGAAPGRHLREALAKKGLAAGEYTMSPSSGEPLLPLALAVMDDSGEVDVVLAVSIRISAVLTMFQSVAVEPAMRLGILDHAGIRMQRFPASEENRPLGGPVNPVLWSVVTERAPAGDADVEYDGEQRWLFSYQQLRLPLEEKPYLYIVAGIPKEQALGQARAALSSDLILMLLAALLAVGAALMIGEARIVRPLGRISLAARRIAEGELAARSQVGAAPMELAGLGLTFDSMAMTLQHRDEKRRRILEDLRQSRKRFKDVAGSMSDWIWEVDAQGCFTFNAGQVLAITGYEPWEVLGRNFAEFYLPGERERAQALFDQTAAEFTPIRDFEAWHMTKGGKRVCLRTNGRPIRDVKGRFAGVRGVCVDVTQQKLAQDHIMCSLREKEILLKEVHHRVKNNLQIISSLMSLESHKHQDIPEVAEAFEQMRGRVRSISLIHEKLYSAENYAEVNMAGYVESLSTSIRDANARPGQTITLRFELAPLLVPLDRALPLGLLVNEAVTNSFKHAFNGKTSGEVFIRLESDNGWMKLLVEDDGCGLQEEIRQEIAQGRGPGLGMQLIKALTEQLGGSTTFPETRKGTSILASFPRTIPR